MYLSKAVDLCRSSVDIIFVLRMVDYADTLSIENTSQIFQLDR